MTLIDWLFYEDYTFVDNVDVVGDYMKAGNRDQTQEILDMTWRRWVQASLWNGCTRRMKDVIST